MQNVSNRIHARDMGVAVLYDPQFRMPVFPKLSKSLRLTPFGTDGMLFDGAAEKQLIRGPVARTLLPEICALADGQHHTDDIVASLHSFQPKLVFDALALLYTRGLLQEGHGDGDDTPLYQVTDRHVDLTRVNVSTEQALDRLLDWQISIDSKDMDFANELEQQLELYGIENDSEHTSSDSGKKRMAIGYCSVHELRDFRSTAETYFQNGVPLLLLTQNEDTLYMMFFERGETYCFECFLAQTERIALNFDITTADAVSSIRSRMAACIACVEVYDILSRIVPSYLVQNSVKEINLTNMATHTHRFSRVPFCPCCDTDHTCPPTINYANQFESFVEFPSRKYINPKDHQHHYKPSNLALSRDAKVYGSSPQVPLTRYSELQTTEEGTVPQTNLEVLTKILLWTAGIKEVTSSRVKRWAPTGGNLGSVGIYFINLGVSELPGGLYFYEPFLHSLAEIAPKIDDDLLQRACGCVSENPQRAVPVGLFVFTGALDRVSQKYREFAYRVLYLDAGVALAQSQAVSETLGWRVTALHKWDDVETAKLLQLRDWGEVITNVAVVWGGAVDEPVKTTV